MTSTTHEFHNNGAMLTGSDNFWGVCKTFADNAEKQGRKFDPGVIDDPARYEILKRSIPFGAYGHLPKSIRARFTAEELFPFADDLLDVVGVDGLPQVKHVTNEQLRGLASLAKAAASKMSPKLD